MPFGCANGMSSRFCHTNGQMMRNQRSDTGLRSAHPGLAALPVGASLVMDK